MGQCYLTKRGKTGGGSSEQLGIYPTGTDGRPAGNVIIIDKTINLSNMLFRNNINVNSISFPENLKKFDSYCFEGCNSLSEVILPKNLNSISEYCFNNNTGLMKIEFDNNLSEIEQYAFNGCSNLSIITIPEDIKKLKVNGYAFSGCSSLDNKTISTLTQLIEEPVDYSFAGLTKITDITTNFVKHYYFKDCTNLKKVTILKPNINGSTLYFGNYAFNGCTNLNEVVLPEDIENRENYLYYEISHYMFQNNANLSKINIPSTLTTIRNYAFYGCTALNNITLPSTLTEIDQYAFYNCSGLYNLTIEKDASFSLGEYAFYGCASLRDETVTDILEHSYTVYPYAFSNCTNLKNLKVKNAWSYMFQNCTNLQTIQIYDNSFSETGSYVFHNCTSLKTVEYLKTPPTITSQIFRSSNGLPALKSVYFGDGATTIGYFLFYPDIPVQNIRIPGTIVAQQNNTLTLTNSNNFIYYCPNLRNIILGKGWSLSTRLNIRSNTLTGNSLHRTICNLKAGVSSQTLTIGATNLATLLQYYKDGYNNHTEDFIDPDTWDVNNLEELESLDNEAEARISNEEYNGLTQFMEDNEIAVIDDLTSANLQSYISIFKNGWSIA